MAAGDKKADSVPPSEKDKDEKKPGGDVTVDAAFKLLNDAQATAKPSEAQVNSALMAKLTSGNNGDLLTTTVKQDFIVKTGNDYVDFGLNVGTGAARNIADFGKTVFKSVKDPLSVLHDVGTVGAAVVENPNSVKEVVSDGVSKLAFQKGAAEAGNAWGNLGATVLTLYGGGRGALQKAETKAVAGAGSIEQKIAQTNKLLSSVETGAARLESAAIGPAPRLAELGMKAPAVSNLSTRVDALGSVAAKVEKGGVSLAESTAAKIEGSALKVPGKTAPGLHEPTFREPAGPKLDAKAPKTHEPTLREPGREVSPIKEPVKQNAPARDAAAPVKEGPAPVKEGPAPVKEGSAPVKEGSAPVKEGSAPVKEGSAPVKEGPAPVKEGPAPVKDGPAPVKDGGTANKSVREPNANPADDAANLKKTGEPGSNPGSLADDTTKAKPKAVEPGKNPNSLADDATKAKPKAEPANPNSVADDATKAKPKTEPASNPGSVADDATKAKPKAPEPAANNIVDDAAKTKTRPTEPVKEPTKPGDAKPVDPAKPNANVLDDAATTNKTVRQPQENFVRTEPAKPAIEPAKPVKPNVVDDVRTTTNPTPRPGEPNFKPTVVDDARPRVTTNEPNVRPDTTDFRPSVNRPTVDRPIISEPLPKIDGGGVTPMDRVKINNLSDHLDRMPATTPGIGDVKTNLNNFKLEPSPENYRKFADSVRTLERTGGDNLVVLKDKAEVALEVARQTTLMHSVNYTTQSIERLIQTSQAQIAMMPGGTAVHSNAMDLVSRLQGHARAMVTAESAHAEILAFKALRGETQQLQQVLSQVKGAQSALENSIKQLDHAQQSLSAANRLVRTGDTLNGQILDFIRHNGLKIGSVILIAGQVDTILSKTAEGIREQIKAEERAELEKTEKVEQIQHQSNVTRFVEELKQASLYLNSKEIQQQKIEHDNDPHERNRRQNSQFGVTIDDYVYYQRAPGVVAPIDEVRQAVQQNFVRPFRSNVEQQDKTAVQKFDWKKTRFNADGSSSRSDNPYLSSPIVTFRPASKAVARNGGSNNDPTTHANALIAKNYAFAVGPQQRQSSNPAVIAPASEAAEQSNPDRSSGHANNPNVGAGVRAPLTAVGAKSDPTTAQAQPVGSES